VLEPADLEMNVLEFRQRSFQYERSVDIEGTDYAVFGRTETENERQLRPRLVRLTLVVPRAWIVLDERSDLLRVASDGTPDAPSTVPAGEVASEPAEFREGGVDWLRASRAGETLVYLPKSSASDLLADPARARLGIP
jgi:hypothetical protein